MERVRAMLFDAKLGYEHWAAAASTATYVKNRSPSSHSSHTPWEPFFGRKPDVSGMRVFGSKAYVHVPKQLRRKLDSLSTTGTFIGYEPNSKAYRVLMDTGKKLKKPTNRSALEYLKAQSLCKTTAKQTAQALMWAPHTPLTQKLRKKLFRQLLRKLSQ
ncbi:hypothetical protein WJX77_003523 [Trebouxia sp. C0004]